MILLMLMIGLLLSLFAIERLFRLRLDRLNGGIAALSFGMSHLQYFQNKKYIFTLKNCLFLKIFF